MKKGEWTVLSNHGRLLVFVARQPHSTTQSIAQATGLSIRGVQKIIDELERDGYVTRHRAGRRNSYLVHAEMPMRHRLESQHTVNDIICALARKSRKKPSDRRSVKSVRARDSARISV